MEKFKVGSRVAFKIAGEYKNEVYKNGVIKETFDDKRLAIVKDMQDGTLYKVHYSTMALLSEPEESDVPASITITKDEFKEITDKVIVKSLEDRAVVKMLQVFCQLLERELFGKSEND